MRKTVYVILAALIMQFQSISASVSADRGGIVFIENPEGNIRTERITAEGSELIRFVLPEEYSGSGRYPATETFEKVINFAVPEGAVPVLKYSISRSRSYSTRDLAPAKKFIQGEQGMVSEATVIPKQRIDEEKEHAEIVRFGRYRETELYRIVFRPLVIRGENAVFAGRIDASVSFGTDFRNGPVKDAAAYDPFLKSVVNYDYALANPTSPHKAKEPCFLDTRTEWVKMKVSADGIYRVTGAQLRSAGLDLSSMLCGRIKLYSSSGPDLSNNPVSETYHGAQEAARLIADTDGDGYFDDEDYLVFYGQSGLTREGSEQKYRYNKYSGSSYYWIDPGFDSPSSGKEMGELSAGGETYDQEMSVFRKHYFEESRPSHYYEDYNFFLWFNKAIEPFNTHTVTFNAEGLVQASDSVFFRIRHSNETSGNSARIEYIVNGDGNTYGTSIAATFEKYLASSYFTPGAGNTISMKNTALTIPKYYNGFEVIYPSTVTASPEDQYFYAVSGSDLRCRMNMEGSAGRYLFDVSDPLNVRFSLLAGDHCIVDPDSVNSYLLFSGSYRTPDRIEKDDNRSSYSLHSRSSDADMVIIAPSEFIEFFTGDADGRAYIETHLEYGNGVGSIEVVSIEDISNEFGRGYQEPAATRNFIRYAHDNWGTEFFLLAGDGNYYIRPELQTAVKNHIYPPDPYSGFYLGYGSDDFYANLSDTTQYYAQHVSLGRFPVSNISELRTVVNKTVEFMLNNEMDNQRSKVLLVSDDERSTNGSGTWLELIHTRNTELYIDTVIPGYYYKDKLYMTEYPFEYSPSTGLYLKPKAEADLIRKLNGGVNVFCYVGHGAPMQLAHEKLFTTSSYSKIYNPGKYFFMFGATCKFGAFNDPSVKYLAEQMLLSPSKGSVGLINSVSDVYSTANEKFIGSLLESALSDGMDKLTVGEAMKAGKNLMPQSGNSSRYMLLGDPALKLFSDKNIVRSGSSVELYTLRPDSIISTLDTDTAGVTDDDGIMNTMIVDSELPRSYFNWDHWLNDSGDPIVSPLEYTLPGRIILSASSSLEDGSAVTRFILPKDLTYGENKGKVLFYGRNGSGEEFTGSIDSVSIRGDAVISVTDSVPPAISIFYNSENYVPGDPVGQSPVVLARIEDENGVNTSGGIGHKILFEVDGQEVDATPNFTYDLNSYQSGVTFYQFVDLAPGRHNVKVSAWDNFNNYSEKTGSFESADDSKADGRWIGNLLNHPNPVRSKGTVFGFTVSLPSELSSYTITVYTINGRKVKTVRSTGVNATDQFQSVEWDGRDADGDEPANGVYIYILRAKFSDGGTVNKKGKLIFAR